MISYCSQWNTEWAWWHPCPICSHVIFFDMSVISAWIAFTRSASLKKWLLSWSKSLRKWLGSDCFHGQHCLGNDCFYDQNHPRNYCFHDYHLSGSVCFMSNIIQDEKSVNLRNSFLASAAAAVSWRSGVGCACKCDTSTSKHRSEKRNCF